MLKKNSIIKPQKLELTPKAVYEALVEIDNNTTQYSAFHYQYLGLMRLLKLLDLPEIYNTLLEIDKNTSDYSVFYEQYKGFMKLLKKSVEDDK